MFEFINFKEYLLCDFYVLDIVFDFGNITVNKIVLKIVFMMFIIY